MQLLLCVWLFEMGGDAVDIRVGADPKDIGKSIHPYTKLDESILVAAQLAHGSCTDVPPGRKQH